MKTFSEKFHQAIEKIDAANAQDPNHETVDGQTFPKEILYSQRMGKWLEQLEPEASEALLLAARSQHICRWEIPRTQFPEGREGYHEWRTTLYQFHADKTTEILQEVDYDKTTIAQVQKLLMKKQLKIDPEVQALEDVICLVFLENYFADFSQKHDEEKIIHILRRTWKKMSSHGREVAMSLELSPEQRTVLDKAIHS